MTDNKHAEAVEAVARIVCRAVDGNPDAMDAIDDRGQRIPMWRIFLDDAEEILSTVAALNTRPDVEAMREACARVADELALPVEWREHYEISERHGFELAQEQIATAIRSIPVPTSGEGA